MKNISKSELIDLIAQGETQVAIDALLVLISKIGEKELQAEVVLLSGKFARYKRAKRVGTSTYENQDHSISKINDALIEIIEELPQEQDEGLAPINPPLHSKGLGQLLLLFSLLLFLLLIAVFPLPPLENIETWGPHSPAIKGENVSIEYHGDWDDRDSL